MAKNLKKTLLIDNEEYNIQAVQADIANNATTADTATTAKIAEKIQQTLNLQPSFGRTETTADAYYTGNFDGSTPKAIKYVPSDGGKFTGIVHVYDNNRGYNLGSEESPMEYDEVLNYGQIEKVVSDLKGNPLWKWDPADAANPTGYTSIEYGYEQGKIYGLNTVIGSIDDLPIFEAYADGKAHAKYITPDSYDNAYIVYTYLHAAYFNQAYDDIKGNITKLVFPNTYIDKDDGNKEKAVNAIQAGAFTAGKYESGTTYGFANLETVHINPGITEIGNGAFLGCEKLASIAIPNSVKTIGLNVCKGCASLTSLVLGSTITTIDAGAFSDCVGLKSIAICNNEVTIAKATKKSNTNYVDAFSGCNALTKIYFKGSQEDWNKIVQDLDENNPLKKVAIISISDTAFPFLYICKGPKGEDTSLTSNKMFLKLPDEDLVEISKGAARLERRDSKTSGNVDYFTYDVLAAVIAGINSRITALGSQALALPEKLKIYDTDTTAVLNIPTDIANEHITTEDGKALIVEETVVPSVQELDEYIKDIIAEQEAMQDGSEPVGVAENYKVVTITTDDEGNTTETISSKNIQDAFDNFISCGSEDLTDGGDWPTENDSKIYFVIEG